MIPKAKWLVLALAALSDVSTARASAADVKQKARETVAAAGDYANETKEQFQKNTREQLASVTVQIDQLKVKAAAASGETQNKLDRQIADLDVRRLMIKNKLEQSSKTSGAAWEQMKTGISKAMDELKNGFIQAKATASGTSGTPPAAPVKK